MEQKPRVAGGLFVLIGFIVGTLYGGSQSQIIVGAIGGIAVGLALAGLVWFLDSRRR